MGIFDSINRGWNLTKASYEVLKLDKELLLFPIISTIVMVVLAGGVFLGIAIPAAASGSQTLFYLALLAAYIMGTFVVIFFNAAIIACAKIRFSGGNPTLADGINASMRHIGSIFVWAIIAGTVGLVIRMLERDSRSWMARIVIGFVGAAWAVATFFVIPAIVLEGKGPIEAMKGSIDTVRRTWGEMAVGRFSTWVIFTVLGLVGLVVMFVLLGPAGAAFGPIGPLVVIGIFIFYMVLVSATYAAINGILTAALYEYAKSGRAPTGFDQNMLS
jgi:hypothetical protein